MIKKKVAKVIEIQPPKIAEMKVTVKGISPLVLNCFPDEVKKIIKKKHSGDNAVTDKEKGDTSEAEYHAAFYRDPSRPKVNVLPSHIFKACMEACANRDKGFDRTRLREAVFIKEDFVEIHGKPEPFEYPTRPPSGGAKINVRPRFKEWRVKLTIQFNESLVTAKQVINLLNSAGFGCGICEGRPQKTALGWGRFMVEASDAA